MIWTSPFEQTISVMSYLDLDLNGRRVKARGYAPSWERLAPHLVIPDEHTGTLTGNVELRTTPDNVLNGKDIICTLTVGVKWDDVKHWHYDFCRHGNQTYRHPCFIDLRMGNDQIPPIFLFFTDEGKNHVCVENYLAVSVRTHLLNQPGANGMAIASIHMLYLNSL